MFVATKQTFAKQNFAKENLRKRLTLSKPCNLHLLFIIISRHLMIRSMTIMVIIVVVIL